MTISIWSTPPFRRTVFLHDGIQCLASWSVRAHVNVSDIASLAQQYNVLELSVGKSLVNCTASDGFRLGKHCPLPQFCFRTLLVSWPPTIFCTDNTNMWFFAFLNFRKMGKIAVSIKHQKTKNALTPLPLTRGSAPDPCYRIPDIAG